MSGGRYTFMIGPWIYGLVGLSSALLAVVTLWQIRAGPEAGGPLPLVGELRAAPPRTTADIEALRAHVRRRLDLSPTDPSAWMTLAYAARAEEGRCGPTCNAALARAYRSAPLDPVTFAWRARFSLENWPALTPGVRDLTIAHMRRAWSTPEGRLAIRDMGVTVRDPSGRLAAKMVAGSLHAQPLDRPDN
ncbi:MAG: O-antigen polymerase [Caulobacter sp.]|nr:O-antigen polymerase [Caulobacter sp.]